MTFLEFVRQFDYIREVPDNRGQRVEAVQRWCGGVKGEPWCCDFATWMLDAWFKAASPIERGGACQDVYAQAKAHGWLVTAPEPNDLFLYVTDADHAHHIGFVTQTSPLTGIAGNTSEDGQSTNGDGVHEHALTVAPQHIRFVAVPGLRGR